MAPPSKKASQEKALRQRQKAGSTSSTSPKGQLRGSVKKPERPVVQGSRLIPSILLLIVLGIGTFVSYQRYGSQKKIRPEVHHHPASTTTYTWDDAAPGAAYIVVDVPGKGKGAIATRDIKQGEVILEEKPLFMVPPSITGSPVEFIKEKLSHLNGSQRAGFWGLSFVNLPADKDPQKDLDDVAVAIFETNAVKAGDEVGIFPRMARLNHGCSSAFNSVYSFRELERTLYIHAISPIAAGEELLTTYTDTKKPRDQRRAYLEQNYGFRCTCSVCSLPEAKSKASDARLSRMASNWARFAKWIDESIDGVEALRLVREIWKDADEEGYLSERGRLAADAVWVSAGHRDADAVRKWGAVAVKWYDIELGVGNEHSFFSQAMIEHPERHPAWGSRQTMSVGGPEGT